MLAKIKNKQEIAQDTLLVEFDVSPERVNFKPGQYFYVNLINPAYMDERGASRHFTMVNSPVESDTLSFATRIRESAFKKSIQELPIGAQVDVGPIEGEFTLPQDPSKPLVFLTGGIGITPFISMLKYIQDEKLGYQIILIYSNKDQKSAAFLPELEKIAKDNPNIKLVLTMTEDENWTGEKGRIDEHLIKKYVKDLNNYTYLVSGPPTMVEDISKALQKAGVDKGQIKKENFNGY